MKIKPRTIECPWGFGARSFGIRGIRIVLDDIPLTTPDGQSQVDNIPFDLIQNIEILKVYLQQGMEMPLVGVI